VNGIFVVTESFGMLTIRLARVGKTKQAQYRMVVADHRRAVTGRFIDVVGNVNPLTDPATVTLKKDEISQWLDKGAQPSETVRTILVREDILKAPKNQAQRPSKAPKRPDKFGKAEGAPAAQEANLAETAEEVKADLPPAGEDQPTDAGAETEAQAETEARPVEAEEQVEPQAEPKNDHSADAPDEPSAAPQEPENGDTDS
jgi:small subunit ribosomal protein S16